MPRLRSLLSSVLATAAAAADVPTGLLADFQRSPALGVRAAPRFSWIVPPCASAPDQLQTAFAIVVSSAAAGGVVWSSGRVAGADSTYVAYAGPPLNASSLYTWTVSTWTAACTSAPSAPATFATSLLDAGFDAAAKFINAAGPGSNTFAYLRRDVDIPAGVVAAVAHVTAVNEEHLLSAYKLYVDGALANIGPGRGEAPVWGGDGAFRGLPYQTLDLTAQLAPAGAHALALVAMHASPPLAILQVVLWFADGGSAVIVTNSSWSGLDGDAHRGPGPAMHGSSAGTGFLEYIDARAEPVGWRARGFAPGPGWAPAAEIAPTPAQRAAFTARMEAPMQVTENVPVARIFPVAAPPEPPAGVVTCGVVPENDSLELGCVGGYIIASVAFASFGTPSGSCAAGLSRNATCDAPKSLSVVQGLCLGRANCTVPATNAAFGGDPCFDTLKTLAAAVTCSGPQPSPPPTPVASAFVADFGIEFQGGLVLDVVNGTAGLVVNISCGESLTGGVTVGYTWGWEFWWTLRDGAQTLEQHKFMECRYVSLVFQGAAPAFTLRAWKVSQQWVEDDSSFTSSSSMLDAVYDLCRYTTHAAALDTYTDSNTRERCPYEADGIIFASSRLLTQRNFLFARHSHAFVLQNPTWPVEWQQLSAFLGWQDYMATGQPDLALAFADTMHERTKISFLNASNGLLDTAPMGRHIVDWMPDGSESDETVARGMFTNSLHHSVSNFFAIHGLDLLSQLMAAGGRTENATAFAAESAALKAAVIAAMWNGTSFCDGACAEVGGNSRVMTQIFALAFGLVPPAEVDTAWRAVTTWGLEQLGDYGAFWYQAALGPSYYAPYSDRPDDGTAMVTALTKCDTYSWCSGLLADNLTMTRESWHDGTYSHGWGASAVAGVAWGILGIHQTAPAFATFLVKPKLGPLSSASGKIPSLPGYISVNATPGAADVGVPCNTLATLCAPRSASDAPRLHDPAATALLIDGAEVAAARVGGHLCASAPVGCGAAGAPRRLRLVARA